MGVQACARVRNNAIRHSVLRRIKTYVQEHDHALGGFSVFQIGLVTPTLDVLVVCFHRAPSAWFVVQRRMRDDLGSLGSKSQGQSVKSAVV